MATYPSFAQWIGSAATPMSGIRADRASNGDIRAQILHSADRKIFKVLHRLTTSEKGTLDTFYTTNKALELTFVWKGDDVSYNCIFLDAPQYTPRGAGRFNVMVMLAQKDA